MALDHVSRSRRAATPSSVVVLGMHRSGTSAAARLVNLLGPHLGPTADLYTEWDNPAGHWESRSLLNHNESILAQVGGSHWAPPEVETLQEALRIADTTDARDLFKRIYPEPGWVWKDPRTCLTLPLWRRSISDPFVALMVSRHPLEVAASLERRNQYSIDHGIALWERYVRSAVAASDGIPLLPINFDALMNQPLSTSTDVARWLRSFGVHITGHVRTAAASLSPGMRHRAAGQRQVLSPEQQELWDLVRHLRPSTAFVVPSMPPETASTEMILSRFRPS